MKNLKGEKRGGKMILDILKTGALAIQVCTNIKSKKIIEREANKALLCGTRLGWRIDERESRRLNQSKVPCAEREGFDHYILYA